MTRRCFTILEVVLAATLAGVVVLGCMSAMLAMGRADRTLNARFREANDLARIQLTMERAFSTLILAPSNTSEEDDALLEELGINPPDPGQEEAEPVDADADPEAEEEAEPEVVRRPRVLLELDQDPMLTSMLQRSRFAAGGGGGSVAAPQRLELVLSSVPIRPPSVQSTAWANALVGVEDLEQELTDGQEEYTGVRGAFVLRPDDPTDPMVRARTANRDDRVGWTLWWQPIDGRSEPARIASGLAACHFQLFFNREMLDEHAAFTPEAMPTYAQLEVETLTGLYADYLFEIVWTVDALVEEEEPTTTAGAEGEGIGGANGAGGRGGAGGQRDGFGRDGAGPGDGDLRARPRGITPRTTGPGRQIEGQPRRQGPPPGNRSGGGGGRDGGGGGGGAGGGGARDGGGQ